MRGTDVAWSVGVEGTERREIGIVVESVAFQPIERWSLFQLVETALVSAVGLLIAALALRPLLRRPR